MSKYKEIKSFKTLTILLFFSVAIAGFLLLGNRVFAATLVTITGGGSNLKPATQLEQPSISSRGYANELGSIGINATMTDKIAPRESHNRVAYECSPVAYSDTAIGEWENIEGWFLFAHPGLRKDAYEIPYGNKVWVRQFSTNGRWGSTRKLVDKKFMNENDITAKHPSVEVTFEDPQYWKINGTIHHSFVHIWARKNSSRNTPYNTGTYYVGMSTCAPKKR